MYINKKLSSENFFKNCEIFRYSDFSIIQKFVEEKLAWDLTWSLINPNFVKLQQKILRLIC